MSRCCTDCAHNKGTSDTLEKYLLIDHWSISGLSFLVHLPPSFLWFWPKLLEHGHGPVPSYPHRIGLQLLASLGSIYRRSNHTGTCATDTLVCTQKWELDCTKYFQRQDLVEDSGPSFLATSIASHQFTLRKVLVLVWDLLHILSLTMTPQNNGSIDLQTWKPNFCEGNHPCNWIHLTMALWAVNTVNHSSCAILLWKDTCNTE